MALQPVDAAEGYHNCSHPCLNRFLIRSQKLLAQQRFKLFIRHDDVALVDSSQSITLTYVVFCRRQYPRQIKIFLAAFLPLQARYERAAKACGQIGFLPEALIRPAPKFIPRVPKRRRKRPLDSGSAHFLCNGLSDPPHQIGIIRRTKTDIVRINCRPVDIIMTMHCVYAVQKRNAKPALKSGLLHPVDMRLPVLRRIPPRRRRTAPA